MLFFVSSFRTNLESNHKDLAMVKEESINMNNLYNVKLKVQLTDTEKWEKGRKGERKSWDANILS